MFLVRPKPLSKRSRLTTTVFQANPSRIAQHQTQRFEGETTLKQACPPEYQRAQCAFKDSMIHEYLQFILRIAFRCVLHRCENQEIRCWKFWLLSNNLVWQVNKKLVVSLDLWRQAGPTAKASLFQRKTHVVQLSKSVMILPQVHLRKPCYDFYFL